MSYGGNQQIQNSSGGVVRFKLPKYSSAQQASISFQAQDLNTSATSNVLTLTIYVGEFSISSETLSTLGVINDNFEENEILSVNDVVVKNPLQQNYTLIAQCKAYGDESTQYTTIQFLVNSQLEDSVTIPGDATSFGFQLVFSQFFPTDDKKNSGQYTLKLSAVPEGETGSIPVENIYQFVYLKNEDDVVILVEDIKSSYTSSDSIVIPYRVYWVGSSTERAKVSQWCYNNYDELDYSSQSSQVYSGYLNNYLVGKLYDKTEEHDGNLYTLHIQVTDVGTKHLPEPIEFTHQFTVEGAEEEYTDDNLLCEFRTDGQSGTEYVEDYNPDRRNTYRIALKNTNGVTTGLVQEGNETILSLRQGSSSVLEYNDNGTWREYSFDDILYNYINSGITRYTSASFEFVIRSNDISNGDASNFYTGNISQDNTGVNITSDTLWGGNSSNLQDVPCYNDTGNYNHIVVVFDSNIRDDSTLDSVDLNLYPMIKIYINGVLHWARELDNSSGKLYPYTSGQ